MATLFRIATPIIDIEPKNIPFSIYSITLPGDCTASGVT